MNALVQQADRQVRDIDAKIREFYDQVNRVMAWVPEPLLHMVGPVRAGMAVLGQETAKFWERANQLWDQPGDSDRLKEVGEEWVAKVGNVLGDIACTVTLDKLRTNVEWTGRAARAYQATVPPQSAGLNSIKDIAQQMRSSLTSLANSIDAFRIAIGFAFAGFLVAATGSVIGAVTIVGIPEAIAALVTAIGVTLGLVAAVVAALEAHTNTIEVEQKAIEQKIRDLGASWQLPAIGELSDASVRDGDASDWRLER